MLVEGYTDVIALRQAGMPETVVLDGHGADRAPGRRAGRLAPTVLLCQDPDAAGQEAVGAGLDALPAVNRAAGCARRSIRIVRLPARQDPADVVQGDGAEAMRGSSTRGAGARASRSSARSRATSAGPTRATRALSLAADRSPRSGRACSATSWSSWSPGRLDVRRRWSRA